MMGSRGSWVLGGDQQYTCIQVALMSRVPVFRECTENAEFKWNFNRGSIQKCSYSYKLLQLFLRMLIVFSDEHVETYRVTQKKGPTKISMRID